MENLIKLHKAQLSSDRMSCHSATANQVRFALHTAACWLMLAMRDALPQTEPLEKAEFTTIRERLIKIGARVIERLARIRIQLPTSCPERRLFRDHPADERRGVVPRRAAEQGRSTPNGLHCELRQTGPVGPAGSAHAPRRRAKMGRVVHDPG